MTSRDQPYEHFYSAPHGLITIAGRRWDNYVVLRDAARHLVTDRIGWQPPDCKNKQHTPWGEDVLTIAEHEMLFATATGLYLPARDQAKQEIKDVPILTDRIDVMQCTLPDLDCNNAERWISADLIRWLVTERSLTHLRDPMGVFFLESVVVGELNLDHVIEPRLRVAGLKSTFVGTFSARSAHLHALALCGSRLVPSAVTKFKNILSPQETLKDGVSTSPSLNDQPTIRYFPDTSDCIPNENDRFSALSLAADSLTLQGDLNLSRDFTAEGPVDLDHCHIAGCVNLLNAKLKSDSFRQDYIPALTIEAAYIRQDLVLMRAQVTGVTHLHKIRVDGHIGFQGAKLDYKHQTNHAYKQPQTAEAGAIRISSYRASLNLSEARVGGNINFSSAMEKGLCYEFAPQYGEYTPGNRIRHTTIKGGVRMRLARVGGDVKLHSARIFAKKFRSAIDATSAQIKGSVMAQLARNHALGQDSFEARGNVRFRAAKISGQVDFTAAKLRKRLVDLEVEQQDGTTIPKDYAPTHTWSLDLRNARVGAQVKLDRDFVAERGVCLRGARIADRVTIEGWYDAKSNRCYGCKITAPDEVKHAAALGRAIDAFRVQIGGSFYLDGPNAEINGKVDFSLARIRGRFGIGRRLRYIDDCNPGYELDAGFYGPCIDKELLHGDEVLGNKQVITEKEGQWLSITPYSDNPKRKPVSTLAELGVISLQHARIGFELIIGPPSMREVTGKQKLLINNPVLIGGRIDAVHARIGYQVCLGRATFNHIERAQLSTPSNQTVTPNPNTAHIHKDPESAGTSERVPGLTQYNAAVDFTGASVGTDFYVDGAIILGGLCLDSVEIEQDLVLRRGLAYSQHAALALWPGCSIPPENHEKCEKLRKLGVCGEKLRERRHESPCWAMSMRHAIVHRTVSLRPAFAPFGALTILRSKIDGYLEFCPADKEILDPIHSQDDQNSKEVDSQNENQVIPAIINQHSDYCEWLGLSRHNWYVTWSINLSGTHVGVLWWSLERSGWIDQDKIKDDVAKGSLADLLFINDFSYDNFWFFEKNPVREAINTRTVDPADQRLISYVDRADGDEEVCRRFLELQTLPSKRNDDRKKRLALTTERDSNGNPVKSKYSRRLRKFSPQPYEQMASVSKTHGRSDLFAWCHEQKWNHITAQQRPDSLLLTFGKYTLPIVISFTIISLFLFWKKLYNFIDYYENIITLINVILFVVLAYLLLNWRSPIRISKRGYFKKETSLGSPISWVVLKIFGISAGYGYKPRRLLAIALTLLLSGAYMSSLAYRLDIIRPSSGLGDRVLVTRKTQEQEQAKYHVIKPVLDNAYASDYPAFNSFWYAADLLIPVIGLEQAEYWQPFPFSQDSNTYSDFAQQKQKFTAVDVYRESGYMTGNDRVDRILGVVIYPVYQPIRFWHEVHNDERGRTNSSWFRPKFAIFIYIFESLYTVLGWVLVTLGIASATRLIRHE